ncbi:hypothetical protein SDC9_189780 [bioreactor metagenome]|uniref:Uncharacterized protein n=1 Tax=bioreactor metagenome TaxID=1076179 RepID=A0A645I198_9ZZZZ
MAGQIKGITIEMGGNTQPLEKATLPLEPVPCPISLIIIRLIIGG